MSLLIGLRNNSIDGHFRRPKMMKLNKNHNDAVTDIFTHAMSKNSPSVRFPLGGNRLWRVTAPGSLSFRRACHAASEVYMFACMCVAVLWPCRGITARLCLHCYSKQGVFSRSSLQPQSRAICQLAPLPRSLAFCLQGPNCELNTLGSDDFPDAVRKQPTLQL